MRHFAALTLLLLCATAGARPTVVVTIDVESNERLKLTGQVDAHCEGGIPCGLMSIASMLEERGFTGTFFLNVYEYKAWGESALREITHRLQARGHEVALHTHPQWAYDPKRANMFDYSLEEQDRIIREGAELLRQWTGLPVVSHRAGAYTANRHTLEALERNGILLDSSLFLDHPLSRLNGLGLPSNRPAAVGRVIEIPVTAYRRQELPKIPGCCVPPYSTVRKIDVNWFLDEQETRNAFEAVVQADVPFIVMFLHSYSFIESPGTQGQFVGRPDARKNFALLLDLVLEQGLPVQTFRDIAATHGSLTAPGPDVVPQVTARVPTHHYLGRQLRAHTWLQVASVALAALPVFLFGLWLKRRRTTAA